MFLLLQLIHFFVSVNEIVSNLINQLDSASFMYLFFFSGAHSLLASLSRTLCLPTLQIFIYSHKAFKRFDLFAIFFRLRADVVECVSCELFLRVTSHSAQPIVYCNLF